MAAHRANDWNDVLGGQGAKIEHAPGSAVHVAHGSQGYGSAISQQRRLLAAAEVEEPHFVLRGGPDLDLHHCPRLVLLKAGAARASCSSDVGRASLDRIVD